MRKLVAMVAAFGLVTVAACSKAPQEQAADNIEANAESMADNLESMADNAGSEASANALEAQADNTRAMGDNMAEDMRTNDPDTNLANGI